MEVREEAYALQDADLDELILDIEGQEEITAEGIPAKE